MANIPIPCDCYTLADVILYVTLPGNVPAWFASRGWVSVGYDSNTGNLLYLPEGDPRVEEARRANFLFAGDYGETEVT